MFGFFKKPALSVGAIVVKKNVPGVEFKVLKVEGNFAFLEILTVPSNVATLFPKGAHTDALVSDLQEKV